jgi:hypothetical protein
LGVGITFLLTVPTKALPQGNWTGGAYYGGRGTFFADVTGDGMADAIVVNDAPNSGPNWVVVRRSTGTHFSGNEPWIPDTPYYGSRGTFFADVDGDGKADAIVVNDGPAAPNFVVVRRSTGKGFGPNEPWIPDTPYYGSRGTFFADVTGDGKADAIVVNDDGITVRRSTGTSFSGNERWTEGAYYGGRGTFFADVDGDGKADAIVVNDAPNSGPNWVVVRRSTGTHFSGNEPWIPDTPYYGSRGTFFADVDGDGKADAIVVNDGPAAPNFVVVRRSTGKNFSGNEPWIPDTPYYGSRGTYFADVNGDRKADAIVVNDDGVTVRLSNGSKF